MLAQARRLNRGFEALLDALEAAKHPRNAKVQTGIRGRAASFAFELSTHREIGSVLLRPLCWFSAGHCSRWRRTDCLICGANPIVDLDGKFLPPAWWERRP